MASSPQASAESQSENWNLFSIGLIIFFGIFATTLPQPQVLGRLPILFFLKDQLHTPRGDVAKFFLICGLAWYLKPIAGILTDAFPLFGTRRRYYMIISSALAAASWIVMAFVPKTYDYLLWTSVIVNLFMVMASTVTGAYLVEAGQRMGTVGRLTSLRMFVQNGCQLLNGYAGGVLAGMAFFWAAGLNAACIGLLAPLTYFLLKEKRVSHKNEAALANAQNQLAIISKSKTLWIGLGFIFLFYFAPGFGTMLTYRQSDDLHFSKEYIGLLTSISGGAGILSAIVYGFLIKRLSLRSMLFLGIGLAAAETLLYLTYDNQVKAAVIDGLNGFCFGLAEIALMDLAARSTPKSCEGLGYSLIMSFRNVAIYGADYLGSAAADKYKVSFGTMVWVNALSTAAVIIFLFFMPASILRVKDQDVAPPAEAA
jgi:MFS family permease